MDVRPLNIFISNSRSHRIPKGSWSSGYDVCFTRRRSPVRIRLSPPLLISRQLFFEFNSIVFSLYSWLGPKHAVVCFIDPGERTVSLGAAILPFSRLHRCVPHAQRYLIYRNAAVKRQLPSGRPEALPPEGDARTLHYVVLQPPERLMGVAAYAMARDRRDQRFGPPDPSGPEHLVPCFKGVKDEQL